jgi:hypothetical protein
MTQRIRELLDAAVSQVEPREVDPVPLVLRRARGRRKRAVTAGALAVTMLAVGAVVGWPALTGARETPMAEPVSGPPPTPRLVGGQIVAGGIRIPVPAGWTVSDEATGCQDLTGNIVLLAGPDDIGCSSAPIEIRSRITRPPVRVTADLVESWPPLSRASMVTLAGGEPGWLTRYPAQVMRDPRAHVKHEPAAPTGVLWLPWSQLAITLRVDAQEQSSFLESIRSTPRPGGRLVIGTQPEWAALLVDGQTPGERIEDSAAIGALLELLRHQEAVMDGRRACAAPEHPSAVLILESGWDNDLRNERSTTIIVVTLAPECREAVSAEGGRVRLSQQTFEELMRLFGIAAQ